MKIDQKDGERFFKIWWNLLYFVNQKLGLVPELIVPDQISILPTEKSLKLRTELWAHPELLESFIQFNPAKLAEQDLAVASSWRQRIQGKFILFKHLKKYSVFLSTDESPIAYGVKSLALGLDELVPYPPTIVEAVLLPLEGILIYDTFIAQFSISIGDGLKSMFKDSYNQAKSTRGIITSLSDD